VLPGIFRAKLIDELNAKESILFMKDLVEADEILLCNSVRGVAPALLDIHSIVVNRE
jgi:branched-subunit amino acid aminotransferase/4-amino-4-deoxychorismate lyase